MLQFYPFVKFQYDIYHCCVYSEKTPDDGQGNCPKHLEFYSKNKFEKLVHLVGFIRRICHDARSPECQNLNCCSPTFSHGKTPKIISLSRGNPTQESVYRPENIDAYGSIQSLLQYRHLPDKISRIISNFSRHLIFKYFTISPRKT